MRDLRKYAKQSNVRFIAGMFFLLFIVGEILIWVFYGNGAAGMGFLCLLGALVPVALIIGVFILMDWIVKRARPE